MNENNMNTPTNNEAPAYAQQPAPQAPVYAAPQPVAQGPKIFRIFGLISFILGFVDLAFSFIPYLGFISLGLSVVGIVFGILGMRHPAMKGKALAGMICNIVALVLTLIFTYGVYYDLYFLTSLAYSFY